MPEDLSQFSNLQPVILGGDIGTYSLGLQFYEAFGVRSLCVANAPVDLITKSVIFDIERIPSGSTDEELLAVLKGIAAVHSDKQLVLMANTDSRAMFIAKNRQALSDSYLLPFPTPEAIDLLCRKDSFGAICAAQDVRTPQTVVVDLAPLSDEGWLPPVVEFEFPVVAKAAVGDSYDRLEFPGKKKIWFVDSQEELDGIWQLLREAAYSDPFLVQEMIPGDDTQMRSLTMYVDSQGEATLLSAARVLLEDPSPTMIGNPVAMITEPLPELWEPAMKILQAGGYRGFANFDIKIDPRGGAPVFFEVNPRIGRNSYYVTAAGVNPLVPMIKDLLGNQRLDPIVTPNRVLYSLVPVNLVKKYVRDESLVEEVEALAEGKKVFDPLESPVETNRQRRAIVALQKLNYYRKFKKYYRHGSIDPA